MIAVTGKYFCYIIYILVLGMARCYVGLAITGRVESGLVGEQLHRRSALFY